MKPDNSTKYAFYAIVVVIAILLFISATYVTQVIVEKYNTDIYNKTQAQLSKYQNQLVTNLQVDIQIVRGLPGMFALNPHMTQHQFATAVSHLLNAGTQIRNIAAAPDLVIKYLYPIKGNEKILGFDYRTDPDQFKAADKARITRNLVLAGPLNLKQDGVGLITRIPVYLEDKQGKSYFWGLISAVIDAKDFFISSGLVKDDIPIDIALRGTDSLGAQGRVFWGDPALFNDPRLLVNIELPTGYWQMVAAPKQGWDQLPKNIWWQRIIAYLVALMIFTLLISFIRFIFSASLANLHFRNLLENAPVPYLLVNASGDISFMNQSFSDTYGYQIDDLPTLTKWWTKVRVSSLEQPETIPNSFENSHLTSVPVKIGQSIESEIVCKNNDLRYALLSTSLLKDTFESEQLIVVYDITARKSTEEQLRFASRVFNQAHEGIIITDTAGAIVDVNPAFCKITGYSREDALGRDPNILSSGKHSAEFFAKMWQEVTENGYWHGEVWNRKKNGEPYTELLTISALLNDEGLTYHYVGLFSDITQTKQQQETLRLMAHYDVLTKLPNRVLFADRFTQALAHSKKTKTSLAICFLDLDNFKPVNDNYGHEVGDQLLVQVASRLQMNLREEDTISRFGGDEFAILFRDIESQQQCQQMLERIHYSLAQPYLLQQQKISISASSGVVIYPMDDADLDTLLRHADQAMYQAKLKGKNTYQLFSPEQNLQTIKKNSLLQEVREALLGNQLQLYYQPKVQMKTGQVIGVEALIRWHHPEKGIILPLSFLPLISETKLEIAIGNWVIETALSQLDDWRKDHPNLEVSINVSSHHMQSSSFIADLEAALARHPEINASSFQLEILESSALGDVNSIIKTIKTCRDKLGMHVALDDFGTGYSSLTHLRHLAVNAIKIDQSFVREMLSDPHDYTIVDSVIGLTRAFNRQLIAEGVESNEHGLILLMMGCEQAQGFAIAKPMPLSALMDWLLHYQPNKEWMQCGEHSYTQCEVALKLFKLTSERWISLFNQNIKQHQTKFGRWPTMTETKCHCGSWIQRARVLQTFDSDWLQQLDSKHRELHTFATELRNYCIDGQVKQALSGLPKLKSIYNEMQALLEDWPCE